MENPDRRQPEQAHARRNTLQHLSFLISDAEASGCFPAAWGQQAWAVYADLFSFALGQERGAQPPVQTRRRRPAGGEMVVNGKP